MVAWLRGDGACQSGGSRARCPRWTPECNTHSDGAGVGYHGRGMGVPSDEGVLVAAFDGNHGWFWAIGRARR